MEILYEKSFEKDLLKLKDRKIREQVKNKIIEIKNCLNLSETKNLKKHPDIKKFTESAFPITESGLK